MAGRYVHLSENLYYDSQDKVIVKNMGNRYVFVRHDRRSRDENVKNEKRLDAKSVKDMTKVAANLYYDCVTKQLFRKTGSGLVLYTRDRRKGSRAVSKERRKNRFTCKK
jgi:hypothetical protein